MCGLSTDNHSLKCFIPSAGKKPHVTLLLKLSVEILAHTINIKNISGSQEKQTKNPTMASAAAAGSGVGAQPPSIFRTVENLGGAKPSTSRL